MKILLGTSMWTAGIEGWGKTKNTVKLILFETKNVGGYIERHLHLAETVV
jgi:hypothetical protein